MSSYNSSDLSKPRRAVDTPVTDPIESHSNDITQSPASTPSLPIDKATMLCQAARLKVSFESFNHLSLQQSENNLILHEHDAAILAAKEACNKDEEACRQLKKIYDAAMLDLQKKMCTLQDLNNANEDNLRTWSATQDWLSARCASAGENLIEEATSLVTSIEGRSSLSDISPSLQRVRAVFDKFKRLQERLAVGQRFNGDRAKHLYRLMDVINAAIDGKAPAVPQAPNGESKYM